MLVPLALIDNAVARVQTHMLPDQTLLELLISELDENTQRLHQDSDGAYRPIDTWDSVAIDANGLVFDFCSIQRNGKSGVDRLFQSTCRKASRLFVSVTHISTGQLTSPHPTEP